MWECPDCQSENELDPDVEEGQIIECLECGIEYEIVVFEPMSLTPLSSAHEPETDGDPDEFDE